MGCGGGRDSANMHLGNRAGFDTLNFFGWSGSASVDYPSKEYVEWIQWSML